ncbi:DUF481 domain-containing protein [Xylophilus sp.]|uniref:DUF481 domain-containing protein n=1 Tax=Xylophilus sp. TaxID=2653893 RepID=UPI0013BB4FC8|nr:DUF481 domain-containing protein [Xylophilus sp.]KAF1048231.1 MAG: hypothetical protein GAK38_01480 [Xylophilus sp.]
MPSPRLHLLASAALTAAALLPVAGWSQITLKPDGQWRYLVSAGANATAGNSDTVNATARGEGVRMTDHDKLTFLGQIAYGSADGVTTTQRASLGTQYNRDISPRSFSFASADALRDKPSNIASRYSTAFGVGRHIVRTDQNNFDISTGLGYSRDSYVTPTEVIGQTRDHYGRLELVLAEESNHKVTSTTSLRQKVTVYPNLRDTGAWRAALDSGVSVAMTQSLNLTAGFTYRFDSDPGAGLKKGDAAFVTGVSYRFD